MSFREGKKMKNKFIKLAAKILVFVIMLSLFPINIAAADSWDGSASEIWTEGDGSEGTPYEISTAAQLAYLSRSIVETYEMYDGVHFILTDDIDLNFEAWVPIGGSEYVPFSGIFDGNGKTVSGLTVDDDGSLDLFCGLGLFGFAGENSIIKNLTVSGSVAGGNNRNAGGLVGDFAGQIFNCASNVEVTAGEDSQAGSIVGYLNYTGTILNSFSTSDAECGDLNSGVSYAGGIAGYNSGKIKNCYSAGTFTGGTGAETAGIAGKNSGSIASSFSISTPISNIEYSGTETDCADFRAVDMIINDGNETLLVDALNAWVSSQITQGLCAWQEDNDTVPTNGGFPLFASVFAPEFPLGENGELFPAPSDYWKDNTAASYGSGQYDGTAKTLTIMTAPELALFASEVTSGIDYADFTVTLGDNINLREHIWAPVGDSANMFCGIFDGDSNLISGIFVDKNSDSYLGLFGYTAPGSEIKNTKVSGVLIGKFVGGGSIGGIVGESMGDINECQSYCTIYAGDYFKAGGLVGSTQSGAISKSLAAGHIFADNDTFAGGLVGDLSSCSVDNCYSAGTVTAGNGSSCYVGGLVGFNGGYGVITNSYSLSNVFSGTDSYIGGLAGFNGSRIENCYAAGEVLGGAGSTSGGLVGLHDSIDCRSADGVFYSYAKYDLALTGPIFGDHYYTIEGCGTFADADDQTLAVMDANGYADDGDDLLEALCAWIDDNGTFSGWISDDNSVNAGYPLLDLATGGGVPIPVIETATLSNGTVGSYNTWMLFVKNNITVTWSITSGSLPAGLTLSASTGIISGTPTTAETADFTVTATNLSGSDSKNLRIIIDGAPPVITSVSPLLAGTIGSAYSVTLAATSATAVTWSVTSGSLPAGLSLAASTGIISGTPTAVGTLTFTVTATNGAPAPDNAASKSLSITINDVPPVITSVSPLPGGTIDSSYSVTLAATSNTDVTWSISSGSLPAGLSLAASTGIISGTPTTVGTSTFTVTATNAAPAPGNAASKSLSITINDIPPVIVTSETLPDGTEGSAYIAELTATSNTDVTWSISSGSLPAGLALTASSGTITGVPTVSGSFTFTATATNEAPAPGNTASKIFTVIIAEASSGDGGVIILPPNDPTGIPVIINGQPYDIGQVVLSGDTAVVSVPQNLLAAALAANPGNVVINVSTSAAALDTKLYANQISEVSQNGAAITIGFGGVTYEITPQAIDFADMLAAQNITDLSNVEIHIGIRILSQSSLPANSGTLVVPPIEFTLTAVYQGRSFEINGFESYVTRRIGLTEAQAAEITTAVRLGPGQTVAHIPTKIFSENGVWYAEFKSFSNSVYALIKNSCSFDDVIGKWYKDDVNEAGSRKIINGIGNNLFGGDADITRADFTAIVINALGFAPYASGDTIPFSDVNINSVHYDAICAAYKTGLINGKTPTAFDPNAKITRQEAMAILARAAAKIGYAGKEGNITGFGDYQEVGLWAINAAEFCFGSGLFVGSDNMLRPADNITRGETAAIALRLLRNSDLIN